MHIKKVHRENGGKESAEVVIFLLASHEIKR